MVEKWKENLKNNFSNGPTAKLILGMVIVLSMTITVTLISTRKNVTISIDGKEETFVTYKGTVKEVLEDRGVSVAPEDKVQPALENKIPNKSTIAIKKAVDVSLVVDNKTIYVKTAEDTVKDVIKAESEELKAEGIEFNEGVDEVTPALETKVQQDLNIEIVKVEIVKDVATEEIKFDTIAEEDSDLDNGLEEVRQVGASGEKEITYKIVKKNGKEVSRDIISSKVTKEPVNEIVAQGTRKTFASRNGYDQYKDVIYCQATAYYSGWITATGTTPVYDPSGISTIAVDPRVIPLGSLVYVDGYGYAVAADTGGAIIGNIIDVFVDSYDSAINWGRKYDIPVYIVSYPGEW